MKQIWATGTVIMAACLGGWAERSEQWKQLELQGSIQQRSERVILDKTTQAEQARARARSRSEYGLELRPRVTDEEAGVALRIYLPTRWDQAQLREQLILVAQSEQLRVSALEWQELIQVYRLFCQYRMLLNQDALYTKELASIEPYLSQADQAVELNQLAVIERAKLYSFYLDQVNRQENILSDLLQVKQELRMLVGTDVALKPMADVALLEMPSGLQLESLLKTALEHRSDFKLHHVQAQSLHAAEALARKEDGFRLKYIQPAYEVNYNNGDSAVGLSASFILPWGTRNPDISAYQEQQALAYSTMELQRLVIQHRLQVILKTFADNYQRASEHVARVQPLLSRLRKDLEVIDTGRLEDLRDLLLLREQVLDASIEATRAQCREEQIAVELAEELGTLAR